MWERALYYPYIKVPQTEWFIRTLLYWDRVGSIVPYEYVNDPDRLGPYMVRLIGEELVEPVQPGAHIWAVPNFSKAFLAPITPLADQRKNTAKPWPRIHIEKMGNLADELCRLGLAESSAPPKAYSPWYLVEPLTATEFMAYLAGVLGQNPETPFLPITDQHQHLEPFLVRGPGHAAEAGGQLEESRSLILQRILPAPSQVIEPAELRDFKEEQAEHLQRLRAHVEAEVAQLVAIPSHAGRAQAAEAVTARMEQEQAELVARMREKRWPVDFGTLCSALAGSVATVQAYLQQDWAFGIVGGALAVAPAIYNAFRGQQVDLAGKPLAYAALAEAQLVH